MPPTTLSGETSRSLSKQYRLCSEIPNTMKSKINILLCLIFIATCYATNIFAQPSDSLNIVKLLPPLQTIIDSATANSPYLQYQNAEIIKQQFRLRTVKQDWTKNLGLSTDVIYGTWDYMTMNPSTGTTFLSNQVETRYGIGVYFRLPLYDAVSRKNNIEIQRLEIEEAKLVKEQKIREIRNLVIEQYYKIILFQNLVNIHNKNRQSAEVQVKMIEKQFVNGQATVEELARVTEIYNNALVEYEKAKSDLTTSYMLLQELAGINFTALK